ncbi:hypothetical protein [Nitriliruptor alkaliphilus]|uniref:hypothetical protein n=1 Tax=Nitriliruptor alkaliphilus TaxID=427918 RepID=UPI0012ED0467|nr:hypothetical protein [Nitriliruptor alkaliphilus]
MTTADRSSLERKAHVRGSRDWSHRLAGALLLVVGGLNVAFGVANSLTDQLRLSAGVAGGLIVAGLVTAAVGVLVWRGSRAATFGALVVFVMLLIFQLSEVAAGSGGDPGGVADEPTARFVVLGLLVVSLAVASLRGRHRRRSGAAVRS